MHYYLQNRWNNGKRIDDVGENDFIMLAGIMINLIFLNSFSVKPLNISDEKVFRFYIIL